MTDSELSEPVPPKRDTGAEAEIVARLKAAGAAAVVVDYERLRGCWVATAYGEATARQATGESGVAALLALEAQ